MTAEATMAGDGDHRRLAICLVVAAALHLAVVLSVEVPELRVPRPMPAIDIVLSQESPPGVRATDPLVEPPTPNDLPDAETAAPPNPSAADAQQPPESPATSPTTKQRRGVLADATTGDLASAIAVQAGRLASDPLQEINARVRRLTGPPSSDPELAYYLDSWRRKVERVGNINYPSEARARGLSGTLRLLVAVNPDGELQDVRILASSGHPTLDDGAAKIVRLAAPFSPFSRNMRTGIDVLEIEHTWRFRKDRLTPMP